VKSRLKGRRPATGSALGSPRSRNFTGNRIDILADILGNTFALDAVLSDIDYRRGADEFWFLGDYAAVGYAPIGVHERISRIGKAAFIRGNTDRYLVDGSQSWPNQAALDSNP
jgi:hypothetical protein